MKEKQLSTLSSPVTVLNAVVATGASVAVQPDLSIQHPVVLQVVGITTATVALQASLDGTTYATVGTPLTADGFVSDNGGYKYYRANVTAWTSGAITAKILW